MVESRLTENRSDHLHIGAQMELAIVPVARDDDGNDIVSFAFAPVTGGAHGQDEEG